MTRHEALKRVVFLRTVPLFIQERIAESGGERHLAKGEILCQEHAPCIGLLVVLTGAVKVYKLDARGREMTLFVERPGNSVLDLPLFDGGNYPANAVASEKETTVFIVPRQRFLALSEAHPEISHAAVRHLAIQMRKLIEMLKVQALHTVRARLAGYLLQTGAGQHVFPLRETNESIGSHIGTVREVISRTLTAFEMEGIIERRGRTIAIIDHERLREIAK